MVRTSEPEPQDAAQTGSERVQAWSPLQSDALEDGFVSIGRAAAGVLGGLMLQRLVMENEKARRDNPLARDGLKSPRPVAAAPKGKRSAEEEMRRALMLDYRGEGKSRARSRT